MSYHHLTQEERYQISGLRDQDISVTEIARTLGRSKSTISRELRRNRGQRGYRPRQAHGLADDRQKLCRNGRRVDRNLWVRIEEKLKQERSPDHIAGRFRRDATGQVSHQTIYRWIKEDKALGGDLFRHLRCRKRRRKRYASGPSKRGMIPNRIGIEHRPKVVEKRTQFGDWEGDTIIGKGHRHAIVSLVERKSRYVLLNKVETKSAKDVTAAIVERLHEHGGVVKTLTFDNGSEFSGHEEVAKQMAAQIFFARPYHSWERGTNEQTNGLVRQFFAKESSFAKLTQKDMARVEDRLNNRPRKILAYRTPSEVLHHRTVASGAALRL